MPTDRQILFIQGGGAGVHDDWDDRLVVSLRGGLGEGHQVRYPRMPDEDAPSYGSWSIAIRREIGALDDGAVVVGHSVGGTVLINTLAELAPEIRLRGIVLLSAPFVGAGGWPGDEFELPADLGAMLPVDTAVHLFYGSQDQTVPAPHADLYAHAIPGLQVHRLPDRDHQLNDDLSEVATVIAAMFGPSLLHEERSHQDGVR